MAQLLPSPRLRLAVLVALAVALGVGLVVFQHRSGGARPAATAQVLKVGDQRGGVRALLTASGQLDDAPYRIEWAEMPAAAPLLEALSAGALDIGATATAPFAFAYSNGAQIRAVLATRVLQAGPEAGKTTAIVVPKDSPIRSVADLKGRRLATIKGSVGHDVALKILERAGVDPRGVTFVYLNNGDAKAALGSGSVDAWATWGHYVAIAVVEGGDRVLADGRGLVGKGGGFQVVSARNLEAKRALIRDFLARYVKAREWSLTHRDELAAEVAKETGVPLEVARFGVFSGSTGELAPIDQALIDEQRETFERFRRAGVIDRIPELGGFDGSFNDVVAAPRAAPATPVKAR